MHGSPCSPFRVYRAFSFTYLKHSLVTRYSRIRTDSVKAAYLLHLLFSFFQLSSLNSQFFSHDSFYPFFSLLSSVSFLSAACFYFWLHLVRFHFGRVRSSVASAPSTAFVLSVVSAPSIAFVLSVASTPSIAFVLLVASAPFIHSFLLASSKLIACSSLILRSV